MPFPLCLRGLAQGVEQTQHFWHEPFFNLGEANTVSSRPGLWRPAKLSGSLPTCGDGRQAPCTMSHLRYFTVSEDSQISGLLRVFGLLFFFFLICIYLAVSCLMGSLVVACRLS